MDINEIHTEWSNWVDMKNPYQFGNPMDMKDFQSLLKATYKWARKIKYDILAIQYWLLPLLPGSLATVFATVTYFILVFPCIAGGAYLIATTSVSQFMAALERMGAPRSFSITLAVTLRFLPARRQDLRHIRDAMDLRNIRGFEEKLECIYVPMLMGAAQTAEELSESATARGIEYPGKMSSWRPIGFHIQDVVVTLLFLALCVGGICCKGVLP